MLKNWLVKTKQIKNKSTGLARHVEYLKDKNRSSHKYSNITILNDGAGAILDEVEKRQLYRSQNGIRGGGVRNYATSFVMSLPRDIKQPKPEEWRKIALYAVKQVAQANGLDFNELRKISHIVLHDESSSPDKASHVHLLIGNVMDNKVIKGITQFRSTHAVKKSFNYSVNRLLNEDNNKYTPKKRRGKDLPLHVARAEKAQNVMTKFNDFKSSLNTWADSVLDKKNAFLSAKKAALDFDSLDLEMSAKSSKGNAIADNMLNEIEDVESDFEEPELIENKDRISSKTKRKKRRRIKK